MAQTHVDPLVLRQFTLELRQFISFIEDATSDIQQKLSRLNQTWHDQEYEAFVLDFLKLQHLLEAFTSEASAVIPKLDMEAEFSEKFHQIQI